MSYTQADIDKLKATFAKGVSSMRNGNGELLVFRSLDEYQRLLGIMEAEVAGPVRRRSRVIYPKFSRHPRDFNSGD